MGKVMIEIALHPLDLVVVSLLSRETVEVGVDTLAAVLQHGLAAFDWRSAYSPQIGVPLHASYAVAVTFDGHDYSTIWRLLCEIPVVSSCKCEALLEKLGLALGHEVVSQLKNSVQFPTPFQSTCPASSYE